MIEKKKSRQDEREKHTLLALSIVSVRVRPRGDFNEFRKDYNIPFLRIVIPSAYP